MPDPIALYADLGGRIREAREARGITQHDLAVAVGLTRGSVANLESGRQRVQVHTLIAAAQALGLDAADLLSQATEGARPLAPVLPAQSSRLRRRLEDTRAQIDAVLKSLPRHVEETDRA